MSGFVATPPPAPPATVDADGWFPGLAIADVREAMRIGTEVPDPRVRVAIVGGIAAAIADLSDWRDLQTADGLADVADLDALGQARKLDGVPRLVQLWRRAVMSYAAADLLETHRAVAATIDGRQRYDDTVPTADDHRRNALAAVRAMTGAARVVLL